MKTYIHAGILSLVLSVFVLGSASDLRGQTQDSQYNRYGPPAGGQEQQGYEGGGGDYGQGKIEYYEPDTSRRMDARPPSPWSGMPPSENPASSPPAGQGYDGGGTGEPDYPEQGYPRDPPAPWPPWMQGKTEWDYDTLPPADDAPTPPADPTRPPSSIGPVIPQETPPTPTPVHPSGARGLGEEMEIEEAERIQWGEENPAHPSGTGGLGEEMEIEEAERTQWGEGETTNPTAAEEYVVEPDDFTNGYEPYPGFDGDAPSGSDPLKDNNEEAPQPVKEQQVSPPIVTAITTAVTQTLSTIVDTLGDVMSGISSWFDW